MLDRLIDLLLQFVEFFLFAEIVDEYQRGVILRFGKWNRDLDPGLNLYWPFFIEKPLTISVVPDATTTPEQTFTLVDGVSTVSVTPVLTYRVHNARKALLEVEDGETSMLDATSGVLRRLMTPHQWEEFLDPVRCGEIEDAISKEIRKEAFKWGYEVLRVSFPNFVKLSGSYRVTGVELS